jgi:3,4-dihydroxy 2-butanone 4-phosphate synthase/GTP cyclohydrolase II
MHFDSIPDAIAEIRKGRMVIVTDDADRENEGDLVMAASKITPAAVNFMAKYGRGLICAPITEERARQLGLQRMVAHNREMHKTDFTVSVDAARGITTGISSKDRALTIKLLGSPDSASSELVQPGHVFPLQGKPGGVLRRAGHTEASLDLARLAGLDPSAVVCEILKEDGSGSGSPADEFKKHGLKLLHSGSHYRRQRGSWLRARKLSHLPITVS